MITVPTPTVEAAWLQAEEFRNVVVNQPMQYLIFATAMADAIESQVVVWDGDPDLATAKFTLTEKGHQEGLFDLDD